MVVLTTEEIAMKVLCGLFMFALCIVKDSYQIALYTREIKQISIIVSRIYYETFYSIERDKNLLQTVKLNDEFGEDVSINDLYNGFELLGNGQNITFQIVSDEKQFTLLKVSRSLDNSQVVSDCFDLESGRLHWYGGPEKFRQYWPVEKLTLENSSYEVRHVDQQSVAERYWLQSTGLFVYVDDAAPLFLNQNVEDSNALCFTVQNTLPYNTRRSTIQFTYHIGIASNAITAHLTALQHFFKRPIGIPDTRMVQHPIWSTWARYKENIDESVVKTLSLEILKYGFNNSQLEIDTGWEVCYGSLSFSKTKFPNIRKFTDELKASGYRVTLWVHPFINKGCEPWYSEAKNKGYFVTNKNNNPDTTWWNSEENEAAHIDFTKTAAAKWFTNRLHVLQKEAGIDSFKFDAGENDYLPLDPQLNATADEHPNALTKAYVRTVSEFGPLTEVRSGKSTQDLPIFLRMIDKDSEWTFANGLPTLITTLLQLNMVGYGFVLPDMIGGNGYNNRLPSKELFIRWLQANVFMPSLQFSYVPWDYDQETIEISKNFTDLHAEYADTIVEAFEAAVSSGQPVNAPIWWLDPTDEIALGINDEFLLGDRILSAPITKEGEIYRDVYLPKGSWRDPNRNIIYTGPKWLINYAAPINVLPYFIFVG